MTIERRNIGLIPATATGPVSLRGPEVFRTAIIVNARVYYVDADPTASEAERGALIDAALKKILANHPSIGDCHDPRREDLARG